MKKILLSLAALFMCICMSGETVTQLKLGTKLTLEQAKAATGGFVITDGTKALCAKTSGDPAVSVVEIEKLKTAYLFKMTDVTVGDNTYQKLYMFKSDETLVTAGANYSAYGNGGNFSPVGWGDLWCAPETKENGRDFVNGSCWTFTEAGEGGYFLYSVGAESYLNGAKIDKTNKTKWFFYTLDTEQVEAKEKTADCTTFDIKKATNYDLEAGKFTNNGGWTFETPVNLSKYTWLVVTTSYNASKAGGEFRITDNAGNSIGGEEYAKGGGSSRGSMWLDRWNNQICATVNLDYIKNHGVDITNITNLSFSANQPVSAVYLTNYEDGQAVSNTQGWGSCTGDYVREYAHLGSGEYKIGTIALKYTAAVSGAQVYTVDSFDETNGMTLARHYGVLESGVPYIYIANDEVGAGGDGASNVNFFRVDENEVTGDWSDDKARDNGLIGYYDGGFGPGAGALNGCYLLSQNELHKIDGGEITLGKNRCFFDPAKYQGPKNSAGAKVRVSVSSAEETAIKNVNNALNSDKIYDLNGREVKTMQKGGTYIMGGMKVRIK